MNIHLILQMATDSMPDRGVVCGSQRVTYQALADAVNALADKQEHPKLAYLAETGAAAPVAMFAQLYAVSPMCRLITAWLKTKFRHY